MVFSFLYLFLCEALAILEVETEVVVMGSTVLGELPVGKKSITSVCAGVSWGTLAMKSGHAQTSRA